MTSAIAAANFLVRAVIVVLHDETPADREVFPSWSVQSDYRCRMTLVINQQPDQTEEPLSDS